MKRIAGMRSVLLLWAMLGYLASPPALSHEYHFHNGSDNHEHQDESTPVDDQDPSSETDTVPSDSADSTDSTDSTDVADSDQSGPQAQPGFGVSIDLQPVQTNAPAEEATRLIIYYRDDQAAAQNAKDDPAEGGDDEPGRSPAAPPDVNPNNSTPDQPVRSGQVSVQADYGTGAPLTLPVPVSMAAATAYAAELERDPDIAAVLIDRRVGRHSISTNDTLNYVLWNLGAGEVGTSASEPVWPQGTGSGVTVAVLDTGMVVHPDMGGVWSGGYDFITDVGLAGDGSGRDADPTDTMLCDDGGGPQAGNPHGLQVASVIAARMNNSEGIAGVAPQATIQPVRVISSCGGWLSDVLDGMRWAAGLPVAGLPLNPNPSKVLNLSLGTTSPGVACSPTVQAIVDEIRASGASIIVSTGNDGANAISVPAACSGVIAVTANSKFGNRASYANAGAGTTISAPGGGCRAGADAACSSNAYNYVPVANHTGITTDYVVSAGTSFAAPHVAGAAALLLERNPNRNPDDVQSALINSARAFAAGACDGGLCGAGMLDVQASLASQGFTVSANVSPSTTRGGDTVTLTANLSTSVNSPVFNWVQTSGTSVAINGSTTEVASFVAPQVNETLSFQLTTTDTSGLAQIAVTSAVITIAPVLAPIDPIEVDPNAELRQPIVLANGSAPEAISVDSAAQANGVAVVGNEVIWTAPDSGQFVFRVTPFDSVGSGVARDLNVTVKGTVTTATNNPAGGGALGLHGALLLLIAWFSRRRLVDKQRDDSSWPASIGVLCLALFVSGYTATAAAATAQLNANLWLASLLHIDGWHLVVNLVGVFLLGIALGPRISKTAWLFALVIAAPLAHWLVTHAGIHPWVAGLSTALHAVVAWVAVQAVVHGYATRQHGLMVFGALVASGLAVKVGLDSVWLTHWDHAQTAPALHASAAAIGAIGSAMYSRIGILAWLPGQREMLR